MPDVDTDENIGTPDLLSLLSVFGSQFLPDPIAIDTLTLEEYLELLQASIEQANATLNAIPLPECDPCEGMTEVTFGSTTYPVVPIGCECWFAKNLDTYVFANGDIIPALADVDTETEETWQAWVNNNPIDGARFGRVYSLGARSDSRKICPSGWKVPDYSDANSIENAIGFSYNGSDLAKLLLPYDPITGIEILNGIHCTNDFGFDGFPIGRMELSGGGYNTFNSSAEWGTQTGSFGGSGNFVNGTSENAYAVRCVKYQPNDRGCMDPNFVEFEPNAQEEDGSCVTPLIRGCTDPTANNFNPNANTEVGSCVYGSQEPACNYEETFEYQGYDYPLVEVAGECWFGKNLLAESFSNGDSITDFSDGTTPIDEPWRVGNIPQIDLGDDQAFGLLYNRAAVLDSRSLCPVGWHVSDQEDWSALASQFGGFMSLLYAAASIGSEVSLDGYWQSESKQSNVSGLNLHPAGWFVSPEYNGQGSYVTHFQDDGVIKWGYWFGNLETVFIEYDLTDDMDWIESENEFAASIRCVKD